MCESSERATTNYANCDYENVEDEGIGGELRTMQIDNAKAKSTFLAAPFAVVHVDHQLSKYCAN